MTDKTGGPAFPIMREMHDMYEQGNVVGQYVEGDKGMSLRDHFAGQALVGQLVACGSKHGAQSLARLHEETGDIHSGIARGAYEWADAMLKERAK